MSGLDPHCTDGAGAVRLAFGYSRARLTRRPFRQDLFFEKVNFEFASVHPGRFLRGNPPLCLRYTVWALGALCSPQHRACATSYYLAARAQLEADELKVSLLTSSEPHKATDRSTTGLRRKLSDVGPRSVVGPDSVLRVYASCVHPMLDEFSPQHCAMSDALPRPPRRH